MLTVSGTKSASGARDYYVAALKDYYGDKGEFYGKLAEHFGIAGQEVTEEMFVKLANGQAPNGEQLIQHKNTLDKDTGELKDKHVAGIDLTFSAPKSVSIAAAFDSSIVDIHNAAVKSAIDYYEANYAQTRVVRDGVETIENTGKGVYALMGHEHNRNGEFNLHTHCFANNMVQRADGTIAGHLNSKTYDDQRELGVLYRGFMIDGLREAGKQVEITDRQNLYFELPQFKDLAPAFSTRTDEILAKVEELKASGLYEGASEVKLQKIANKMTAKEKEFFATKEDLEAHQKDMLAKAGETPESIEKRLEANREAAKLEPTQTEADKTAQAKDSMVDAINVLSQNEEGWSKIKIDVNTTKINGGISKENLDKAQGELTADKELILLGDKTSKKGVSQIFTSGEMLEMKNKLLTDLEQCKGTFKSHTNAAEVDAWLANLKNDTGEAITLSADQTDALKLRLCGSDGACLIQGDPGTGKTFIQEMKVRYDQEVLAPRGQGSYTLGVAFTGKAAQEIESAGARYSSTIAGFLNKKYEFVDRDKIESHTGKAIPIPKGANIEIAIDEVSMTSTRDLAAVMQKKHDLEAQAREGGHDVTVKLTMMGDNKQLASIGQGKVFSDAMQHTTLERTELKSIIRQDPGWYRELAVQMNVDAKDLKKIAANVVKALDKADSKGKITEVNEADINRKAADAYLAATSTPKTGKNGEIMRDNDGNPIMRTAAVVTALNKDREEINNMIRDARVAKGEIAEGQTYTALRKAGVASEKRALADSYKDGQLVSFYGYDGVIADSAKGQVVGKDINKNMLHVSVSFSALSKDEKEVYKDKVQKDGSVVMSIPVAKDHDKFTVAEEFDLKLAVGDKIRFTDNNTPLGVKNGHEGVVKSLDDRGNAVIFNEATKKDVAFNLDEYQHLAHGYAITVQGSQGMTKDVMIGALKVKPFAVTNDLKTLNERTEGAFSNPQFHQWNREESKYEASTEKSIQLKDKGGQAWGVTLTVAVADISKKDAQDPELNKVVKLEFQDRDVRNRPEMLDKLKENGFWFSSQESAWLGLATSSGSFAVLGKDHPLNDRTYKEEIHKHMGEISAGKRRDLETTAIQSPEGAQYGSYAFQAMNVVLTRGKNDMELITNDKAAMISQAKGVVQKESINDYLAMEEMKGKAQEVGAQRAQAAIDNPAAEKGQQQQTKAAPLAGFLTPDEKGIMAAQRQDRFLSSKKDVGGGIQLSQDKYKGLFGITYTKESVLNGDNAGMKIKSKVSRDGNLFRKSHEVSRPDGSKVVIKESGGQEKWLYGSNRREEHLTRADGSKGYKLTKSNNILGHYYGTTITRNGDGKSHVTKWSGHREKGGLVIDKSKTMSEKTFAKKMEELRDTVVKKAGEFASKVHSELKDRTQQASEKPVARPTVDSGKAERKTALKDLAKSSADTSSQAKTDRQASASKTQDATKGASQSQTQTRTTDSGRTSTQSSSKSQEASKSGGYGLDR